MQHPRTAARIFGGEAVIISPAVNMVRILNPVASRIWELADGSRTVEEIATILTSEYEVSRTDAERSVQDFVQEMLDKELFIQT